MTDWLHEYRAAVDAALVTISGTIDDGDDVGRAMRYAIMGGGKRLRPILCLAACEAAGGTTRGHAIHRAAAAIELIHTYSLVHDDLPCMDDDALRRGRKTVHRAFDSRTAMLAGFALIPLATRVLDGAAAEYGLNRRVRQRIVRELCTAAGAAGMVGGQILDLEAESQPVGIEALRRVHAMKTGALFTASLRIGGLLAGATDAVVAALGTFGERLGLAFQITDDVLDVTVAANALGKTPGKDQDAGKTTFVSLLGVEAARTAAAAEAATALEAVTAAGLATDQLAALARLAVDRNR